MAVAYQAKRALVLAVTGCGRWALAAPDQARTERRRWAPASGDDRGHGEAGRERHRQGRPSGGLQQRTTGGGSHARGRWRRGVKVMEAEEGRGRRRVCQHAVSMRATRVAASRTGGRGRARARGLDHKGARERGRARARRGEGE